jgi:hypothetical protein
MNKFLLSAFTRSSGSNRRRRLRRRRLRNFRDGNNLGFRSNGVVDVNLVVGWQKVVESSNQMAMAIEELGYTSNDTRSADTMMEWNSRSNN